MRAPRVALAIATAALVGAACGSGELVPGVSRPPTALGSGSDVSPDDVARGVALATLRGRNLVASEMLKRSEPEAGAAEARRALEALDAAGAVPSELRRAQQTVLDEISSGRVAGAGAAMRTAGIASLSFESDTVGEAADLAAYKGTVVSRLLALSAGAYARAAADPTAVAVPPYRDAYAFLREANEMHAGLTSVWELQTDDEAKEVEALFNVMFRAMSSSVAPGEPEPPADVAAAAFVIGADLHDSTHALEPTVPDPGTALEWVAPLLAEALDKYKAGEPGVAEALVRDVDTKVYREARDALQVAAPDVAADIDRLLGPRLIGLIEAGAPDEELEAAVDDAGSAARFAAGQVPGGV